MESRNLLTSSTVICSEKIILERFRKTICSGVVIWIPLNPVVVLRNVAALPLLILHVPHAPCQVFVAMDADHTIMIPAILAGNNRHDMIAPLILLAAALLLGPVWGILFPAIVRVAGVSTYYAAIAPLV